MRNNKILTYPDNTFGENIIVEIMRELKISPIEDEELFLQFVLWKVFQDIIPNNFIDGVIPSNFQVIPDKVFQEWVVFAKNAETAHSFRFIVPIVERSLKRNIYKQMHKKDLFLTQNIKQRLLEIAEYKIKLKVNVKPNYWQIENNYYKPQFKKIINREPKKFTDQEADKFLEDFLNS